MSSNRSNTPPSLQGVRVLIARPHQQGLALATELKQLGAKVLQFPTISVDPCPSSQSLKNCFLNLDQYNHIVAVSVHAVRLGLEWIDQYWPQLPLNIQWYAIGEKTAQALIDADIPAHAPKTGYDSESLLNLPQLTSLEHQKVLMLRGTTGRGLLKQTFEQRGAIVDYANLYERRCPTYTPTEVSDALTTFSPDILVTLSGETLHNLIKLSENNNIALEQNNRLIDKAVLVPSHRVADQARELGFSRIWVPEALNEHALVDCIQSNYIR